MDMHKNIQYTGTCSLKSNKSFQSLNGKVRFSDHKSTKLLSVDGAFSGCDRYASSSLSSECAAASFSTNVTQSCEGKYVYETEHYVETFASRMNLVCDDAYKRSVLSTCLMAGLLVGSLLGGR